MLEEHRKSGPRTKVKGKWLEQTIAETMVSMSEDLYDTDDDNDEAPFTIKKLLRRPSRDPKVVGCHTNTAACVAACTDPNTTNGGPRQWCSSTFIRA